MKNQSISPLVIEAAVTLLRPGQPVQDARTMTKDIKDCLAAGASIVHYHFDYSLERDVSIKQVIDIQKELLAEYPSALLYLNYLRGVTSKEKNAHLESMRQAGVLNMIAFDPGYTMFDILDEEGLPSKFMVQGFNFTESHELVEFANCANVPISVGIYEPGHLRWARAYATAGKFPPGTVLKLYLPAERSLGGQPRKCPGLYPTKESLDMYLTMLEGVDIPWVVAVPGEWILDTPIARYALERGGHIRVGIEDCAGRTDMNNRETVEAAIELAKQVGRPVVTGAEAVAVLKGQ